MRIAIAVRPTENFCWLYTRRPSGTAMRCRRLARPTEPVNRRHTRIARTESRSPRRPTPTACRSPARTTVNASNDPASPSGKERDAPKFFSSGPGAQDILEIDSSTRTWRRLPDAPILNRTRGRARLRPAVWEVPNLFIADRAARRRPRDRPIRHRRSWRLSARLAHRLADRRAQPRTPRSRRSPHDTVSNRRSLGPEPAISATRTRMGRVRPPDDHPQLPPEAEGFNAETLRLNTHTGTHVDVPFHFDDDGPPIDRMPLPAFAGPAAFLDLRESVSAARRSARSSSPARSTSCRTVTSRCSSPAGATGAPTQRSSSSAGPTSEVTARASSSSAKSPGSESMLSASAAGAGQRRGSPATWRCSEPAG